MMGNRTGLILSSILLTILTSCGGHLPYENPFEMGDGFTASFVQRADPSKMERYCDADGSKFIDSTFYSVERRSPQMYDYLRAWVRGMSIEYSRRPNDFGTDSIPLIVPVYDSGLSEKLSSNDEPADTVAQYTDHDSSNYIPDHLEEMVLIYDLVSKKDPDFKKEIYVTLNRDEKGRWMVSDSNLTLFW